MSNSKIILGDNLEVLKRLEEGSVDLIYIDPPFNSNRNYAVVVKDGQTFNDRVAAFKDIWKGGSDTYITFLRERVLEAWRVLKPTGSIYVHCDQTESHRIKLFVLDRVFGENNFRNEIVWVRSKDTGSSKARAKQLPRNTDSIFFYTKSDEYTWVMPSRPADMSKFKLDDKDGKGMYYWADLKTFSDDRLKRLLKNNEAKKRKSGKYSYKRYASTSSGKIAYPNYWDDIPRVTATSNEYRGYPTAKPLALIERIIEASCPADGVVLDFFMGSGTACVAAAKLGRKFIGIDSSALAVDVAKGRLTSLENTPEFDVEGIVPAYDTLRKMDGYAFQDLVIKAFNGTPNPKTRGDKGIDGYRDGAVIQVKNSVKIGRNVVDNFETAMRREDVSKGFIIAWSFGKGAESEAARARSQDGIDIKLVPVSDIMDVNRPPKGTITYTVKDINKGVVELVCTSEDPDGEVINHSWDFSFDSGRGFRADIIVNTSGRTTHTFGGVGLYKVAVQMLDDKGLHSICTKTIVVEEET